MLQQYKTVLHPAQKEIVIKKSRFIASVLPTEAETEVIAFIDRIRKEHREAVHNVFAYQLGYNDEIQRQSDDGEPSGTAGRPVLEVIKREELKNVVVVVTRYFGGILLGAAGLIRAYGQSARVGLQEATIVKNILHQELFIDMDYTWLGKIQNLLMNEGCLLNDTQYTDIVKVKALTPVENSERIIKLLVEATNNQVMIDHGDKIFLVEKDGEILT